MTEGTKIHLSVVTPEREMVNDLEVDQVNIPGGDGDMGILADHAPLFTTMRAGSFSYEKGDEVISLVVGTGYAEVTDNRVTVLAETAEFLDEIDLARAREALAKAEKHLEKDDLEEDEFRKAQDKLFRALARLEGREEE